jgi:hypothetical protein
VDGTVEIKPMSRATLFVAAALVVVFAFPVNALAARDCTDAHSDPTAAQYCNSTQNAVAPLGEKKAAEEKGSEAKVAAVMGSEGPSSGSGSSSSSGGGSSLPFTGADLLVLAAIAAALLAVGLALRQLSSARPGAD